MRKIKNAYDAFWFLHDHPRLNCSSILPYREDYARGLFRIIKIGDIRFLEMKKDHPDIALDTNLDIYWTKVDSTGHRTDNPDENKFIEVWLEFGGLGRPNIVELTCYGYKEGDPIRLTTYHDPDLDCGGPTFDEAFVKLAKLAQKKYGDYKIKYQGPHK